MRAARARLTMKIVGLVVTLAVTIVSAHSCGSFSKSSPLNPANVVKDGLSGVCADAEAASAASGNAVASPQTLQIPAGAGVGPLGSISGLGSGSYTCPTSGTGTGTTPVNGAP